MDCGPWAVPQPVAQEARVVLKMAMCIPACWHPPFSNREIVVKLDGTNLR